LHIQLKETAYSTLAKSWAIDLRLTSTDLNEFDATFSSITLQGGRMNEMRMGLLAKPLSEQGFRPTILKKWRIGVLRSLF